MKKPTDRLMLAAAIVLSATFAMQGCSRENKPATTPSTSTSTSSTSTAGTVPPPPGDSTPRPTEPATPGLVAAPGNEKTGGASEPSTVGTAAAGSPPYTLNAAPEGNPAPQRGTKDAEKK